MTPSPQPQPSLIPLLASRLAALPTFRRAAPLVVRTDAALQRATGRRLSLVRIGGFQPITLVVPGRRTGRLTEVNLLAVPVGPGSYLIAGSNFGRPTHPLWSLNLMSARSVDGIINRHRTPLRVSYLDGEERVKAWQIMCETWPNFALYEQRSGRVIRVFRLEPTQKHGRRSAATTADPAN